MNYAPIGGKYGYIVVNGVTQNLNEWSANLEVDVIDVSGFGATPDSDGNILEQFLTGLMKAEFTIKGRYNNAAGSKPMAPPVNLRPNLAITAVIGYSAAAAFAVTAVVINVTGGTQVRDAGNFEARIKVTGLSYPS